MSAKPANDVTVTAAPAPKPVAATAANGGTAAAEPLAPLPSEGTGAAHALVPSATPQTAVADAARGGTSQASPPLTSTDESSSARGDAETDRAEFPEATFPEASVRDTEAEAADLERRRSVIGLFERLRVVVEHRAGYDRTALFDGWLYRGGLSTRQRVLRDEQRAGGTWLSAYDATVVTDETGLDIDHLVPLAEAWESGGHLWTEATWTQFANDLGDPRPLIAVSAATNRSKGARDPAEWWPPSPSYRCQYAVDWVAVKARWDLAVDSAEQASLDAELGQCTGADFDFAPPTPALIRHGPSLAE